MVQLLAALVLLQADAGTLTGCRLTDVDRFSSSLSCAGHEVHTIDLIADEAATLERGAKKEPDLLEQLQTSEQYDFRSATIELGDGQRAGVMSFESPGEGTRTFVSVTTATRLYLCTSTDGVQQTVDRCRPTLASLLANEAAPTSDALCDVTDEEPLAVRRTCGNLTLVDYVSKKTVAKERANFEAQLARTMRERFPKVPMKTTQVEKSKDRWSAWVGITTMPHLNFISVEQLEGGVNRTILCMPLPGKHGAQVRACPLLVSRLLAERDPASRGARPVVEPMLFGRYLKPPAGCTLARANVFEGAYSCDSGAGLWRRGRGHTPVAKGKQQPCTIMGTPGQCQKVPASGKRPPAITGIAADGAEWVQAVCTYGKDPKAPCAGFLELTGE